MSSNNFTFIDNWYVLQKIMDFFKASRHIAPFLKCALKSVVMRQCKNVLDWTYIVFVSTQELGSISDQIIKKKWSNQNILFLDTKHKDEKVYKYILSFNSNILSDSSLLPNRERYDISNQKSRKTSKHSYQTLILEKKRGNFVALHSKPLRPIANWYRSTSDDLTSKNQSCDHSSVKRCKRKSWLPWNTCSAGYAPLSSSIRNMTAQDKKKI